MPPLFRGLEGTCLCLVRVLFKSRGYAFNDAGDVDDKGTLRPDPTKVGPAGMRGIRCAVLKV